MSSTFYKISCINEDKQCNIIDPISENINFNGLNPITGQRFVKDDIDSIIKRHSSMCLNKNGTVGQCCDPRETNFKLTKDDADKYKGKKFKTNREYGVIKSIDMCEGNKCTGNNWLAPNPYLLCKIGDNIPEVRDNILQFKTLSKDCPINSCNKQGTEIGFGQLISGQGTFRESSYITDLKTNDYIKEDNVAALKAFLEKSLMNDKKPLVDYVLTDNDSGDTLLLRAIKLKSKKCVALLLGNGANVNSKAMDTGMTPLHYACLYGDESMLANLVNYGAQTTALDFKLRPPLFYAVMYGDLNMVNYLTNQDPSVLNFKDKYGNTPLHITMMFSKDPGNMAKFFIDNGVSAEAKNNNGLTASEVGSKRIDEIKKKELETNTEMFLEPFVTLGKAQEDNQKESEIINNINTGITYLHKSHVSENQNLYKGFITPENNLKGPVNFDKYGCYPHASIESQEECEANGGQWALYDSKEMSTFAKVTYEKGEASDTIDPDATPSPDDANYYTVQVTPMPERELPPLDHDSIMKRTTFTPSPTTITFEVPNTTSTPSHSTEEFIEGFTNNTSNAYQKYLKWIGILLIILAIAIVIYLIICKKLNKMK
jgi:hypothetical protein